MFMCVCVLVPSGARKPGTTLAVHRGQIRHLTAHSCGESAERSAGRGRAHFSTALLTLIKIPLVAAAAMQAIPLDEYNIVSYTRSFSSLYLVCRILVYLLTNIPAMLISPTGLTPILISNEDDSWARSIDWKKIFNWRFYFQRFLSSVKTRNRITLLTFFRRVFVPINKKKSLQTFINWMTSVCYISVFLH